MRPLFLSNCEKDFILRSFRENSRIDGRSCTDHRNLSITLGRDRGSCLVVQGNTKVFAQVSCSTTTPKAGRPSEGSLFVNLELSPMAAPHFESGRLGDVGVEICRLLERSLKQSRCLDLESLCIVAGEMVWEIRIDVHVLDYDGAVVDCASVASICALRHFRRPDVTVTGDHVHIHTLEEKEPLPLSLYHHPICVTFGFCDEGRTLVVDPSEKEEQVLDGKIVVAMNSHRELCAVHCSGSSVLQKEQLLRCASKAVPRSKELAELVNKIFEEDAKSRLDNSVSGFSSLVGSSLVIGASRSERVQAPARSTVDVEESTRVEIEAISVEESPVIVRKGKAARTANAKARLPIERDDSDVEIVEEVTKSVASASILEQDNNVTDGKKKRKTKTKRADKDVQSLLDEIEDDVQILLPGESGYKIPSRSETAGSNADVDMIDLADAMKPSKSGQRKHRKNH